MDDMQYLKTKNYERYPGSDLDTTSKKFYIQSAQ